MSADRLIDHYHQLICTATDAVDIEQFIVHFVQRLKVADTAILRFLGLSHLPPSTETEYPPPESALPDGLRRVIAPFVEQVLNQRQQLSEISASLRRLHQPDKVQLLTEADTALRNGMRATDRDRLEDFRDALRLLRAVQQDPVSGRDYYVWFHIGWIVWQMEGNFAEAEEAFYQAARLSASAGDMLHATSLRHQAYMQYLQNKPKQAYATITKALMPAPEHVETLFDAARYAAIVEHEAEATGLLEKCLERNPLYLLFALTDEDFQTEAMMGRVQGLGVTRRKRAVEGVTIEVGRWRRALAAVEEAGEQSGVKIDLPANLREETAFDAPALEKADYFTLQGMTQTMRGKAEEVRTVACTQIEEALTAVEEELARHQKRFDQLKKDWETWRAAVKWLEKEAKEANFSLEPGGPMEAFKLRMQKRLDRVMDARSTYKQSKDNLAVAVQNLKEHGPGLEKTIAAVQARRDQLVAVRDWLNAQNI